MATETVEALVEGGKASAAPPLGPALGPLGVNIGEIVNAINEKTGSFKGMQVPVKVEVDTSTKEFTISVGTPPASELIKKEANLTKGSANPKEEMVADLRIEQLIKVAKMKEDALLGKTLKDKIKEVLGTCRSMGILVEGKKAGETLIDVNEGKFDKQIKEEKTEISQEELKEQEEERKKMAKEIEERRAKYLGMAQNIYETYKSKTEGIIKTKLTEAGIPNNIIAEVIKAAGATEGKPAEEPK